MIPFNRIIQWLLATFVAAILLMAVPFSQREVATQRLDLELSQAIEIQKQVAGQCRELLSNQNSSLERWFTEKITPNPEIATDKNLPTCILRAQTSHISRFGIFAQWNLGFEIFTDSSIKPILVRSFLINFPLPLCFLPLLVFIFLLPITISPIAKVFLLFLHLLFINGLNLIPLIKSLPKLSVNLVTTDRLFPGLLLLSLFLSLRPLYKQRKARAASSKIENLVNSFLSGLIGIWNPMVYTLVGPILYHPGNEIKKLKPFLNAQLVILTLSLVIYGLELSNIYSVLNTLWTPRYLSFSILFCFLTFLVPNLPNQVPLLWELPQIGWFIGVITAIEIGGIFIPNLRSIPTLTRLGLALLLVECLRFKLEPWGEIFSRWKKPLLALLISSLVATATYEFGAVDLVISICNPTKHPSAILPFTLLSGFLLGFLTGGLSAPFFTLVSMTLQSFPSSLIRAALFDGVLVGLMLSPFSLFNLYPALQQNIPLPKILQIRLQQLWVPLLLGLVIYFVGTVTTLFVLPPVCFVFGCLIIFTYRLKKRRWMAY